MLKARNGLHVLVTAVAAGAVPRASAAALELPEIVVTARRLEEPLARVPVAVSVFDADRIARVGAVSLDDIARFTPGFSFHSATGRGPQSNRPTVRGLTTIRNGIANSTVAATFIDGIYLGGSTQSTELFDLERVEILRGPQSTQFGRATYAGAINYVTRPASADLEGGAQATVAEHDTRRASGWVSGPLLGERLRVFAGAGYDRYGGEYRNTVDGSTVGGEESRHGTLRLEASPTPSLDAVLRLGLQETDDDHYATWLQPRTANNCCFRTPDAPRAREYYVGEAWTSDTVTLHTTALERTGGAGFRLDRVLGSLSLKWRTPAGATLTSLTGVVSDEIERGFDASYGAYDPVPFLPWSFLQQDKLLQSDLSQELRFVSPRDRAVRWLAGAYFYRGRLDEAVENRAVIGGDGGVSLQPNFGDLTLNDIENRAIFGAVEADVGQDVTASLELRYAADDVRVTSTPNVGSDTPVSRYDDTFHSLSPRLLLAWRPTDRLMPWVSIARGQSPGTFNATVPAGPDGLPDERYRSVDEEVIWNYEVGLRSTSERTQLALTAYRLNVHDQQFTTIVELPEGRTAFLLDNVGRTAVRGIEAELTALISEGLTGWATYAWTDSEIRREISEDQADLSGSDGSAEDVRRLGDIAGHTTPRVPTHMASLALEYRRPLTADAEWFLGGDWTYESSRFAQEDNLIETGSQSLFGLHAGLRWSRTELSLWATNLTDDDTPDDVQRYIDARFGPLPSFPQLGSRPSSTPRGFAISLPRGRQVGATLRYRF